MNPNTTVACPFCKAQVGESCIDKDGAEFKAGIHIARWYELQNRDNEQEAS